MFKPIDLNTVIYSDIDIDFSPINSDININENERAVIGAIYNMFNTNTGERLFNPRLGFNFKRFIGMPVTPVTALEIEENLYQNINIIEPRISGANVNVFPDEENKRYIVIIGFNTSFSDIRREVSFTLDINR